MLNKFFHFCIKIVFTVLFIIIITPVGLFIRIFGVDFLERKVNRNSSSYWRMHSDNIKSK
jgi:hypothetical protein